MSGKKDRTPKEVAEDTLKQEIEAIQPPTLDFEHPTPLRWGSWDSFWQHLKRKHRLSAGMEVAIKKHLEVKGFDRPELFEKGIRDFGLEP